MNAYGSDDEFTAWLTAQGLALPAGAPTPAVLRQIGSDYVDNAYGYMLFCSQKTGGWDQEREWPRSSHYLNGQELPHDFIPPAWVNASYRAAYLEGIQAGWATGSQDPNRKTKREKVDVIEREYFDASSLVGTADVAVGMPADGMINGMVQPWLCSKARSLDSLFRVI